MLWPHQVELDARGRLCPQPIVDLAACLRGLPVGAVVLLHSDDAAIAFDLPAYCASTGHELLALSQQGRLWSGRVRKLHDRI
jgi:TusA-related sulfurtransferase